MNIGALVLSNFFSDFIQATNGALVIYSTNIAIGIFCTFVAVNFFFVFRNVELIGAKSKLHIGIDLIEKDEISRFDDQIKEHEKAKVMKYSIEGSVTGKIEKSNIGSLRIVNKQKEKTPEKYDPDEDKEENSTLIKPGNVNDDLFIINYEDTWKQLFNTKQTIRIIVSQSTLFAVWYANKVIIVEMAITEKSQHGLGMQPSDIQYCLFLGLIPALIFVIFFARLMISERKHHLMCMKYTNSIMIWLTAAILILKASASIHMISTA